MHGLCAVIWCFTGKALSSMPHDATSALLAHAHPTVFYICLSRSSGEPDMGCILLCAGPNNPHEVRSWFSSLQDKWWYVAYYLGYTKDDIEVVESEMDKNPETQIQKFLDIFQMPDCGAKTIPILHKLGDLSGVAEVHKKPAHCSVNPSNYAFCVLVLVLSIESRDIKICTHNSTIAYTKVVSSYGRDFNLQLTVMTNML